MASINLQGDTSGSISISAPSVAGSNTLTLPATTQTLATQNALGVRNLIINGDMRIAQRGTSVSGITTIGYYTIDRWRNYIGSFGTWTETQDTDVPSGQGFANSLKIACTTANASLSAGSYGLFLYTIEAQMLQHLKFGTANAETLTLSFWIKSNKTGTYNIHLRKDDDNRRIVKQYTISSADTWEKKTVTIEGDTTGAINNDNGVGLQIQIWFGAGSDYTTGSVPTGWTVASDADFAVGQVNLADSTSNYINITGVQLEVGDTATPFEHRPYDMELARCQRYFWQQNYTQSVNRFGTGVMSNPSTADAIMLELPVSMRTSPTLAFNQLGLYDGAATGVIGSVVTNYSTNKTLSGMALCTTTWSAATRPVQVYAINSTAYISASAEL